jgi:uncharacterized protein YjiS (DUF1127 family)
VTAAVDSRRTLFRSVLRAFRRMLGAFGKLIIAWRHYHRDRRLLASLNERELHDIGIDRSVVTDDDSVVYWRWR